MPNRTDGLLLAGIAALLAVFAGVFSYSLNDHVVKEGDQAPAFSIRTDSGRAIAMPDFGGKILVLNFWATWCQPCVEEMPTLDSLQQQFKGQGLVVLGVSVDADPNLYRKFLVKTPVSFETVRQTSDTIAARYGTFQYPETYIIDKSGRVLKKIIGKETWNDPSVLSYVQSLL